MLGSLKSLNFCKYKNKKRNKKTCYYLHSYLDLKNTKILSEV